jgi:tetratricopeptide (TPR) repeat protein
MLFLRVSNAKNLKLIVAVTRNIIIFPLKRRLKAAKSYILITIVITLYLLTSCSSGETAESKPNLPTIAPETIAVADKLFAERRDLAKLREARALLMRARKENAKNFDVEWRLARYNYFLGRHTEDEKEREDAFEAGRLAGRSAIQLEPNKPDGHFWYGANLGEQASRSPLTTGLKSMDDIRSKMNKVIELNPDYELASAYDVLAQLELGSRMLGGKPEKAVEYLEKAIDIEKNNGDVRIHMAEALLSLKKQAEAKKHLDHVLQMKPHPAYLPEYEQQVAKVKKMLESNF